MDYQKDTHQNNNGQTDTIPQRQLTQSNNPVNVLKSVTDFDEISQEISYSFLSKKTEKLASALYLITSFLSDNEPIKWDVREAGLTILSDVTTLGNSDVSDMNRKVKNIMSDIEKIVSLLEISATAGFISEMNLAILKEEYLSLIQTLSAKKKGGIQESFVFARDFFSVRGVPRKEIQENYKGQIKDTISPVSAFDTAGNTSSPIRPSSPSLEVGTEVGWGASSVSDKNSNLRPSENKLGITNIDSPKKIEIVSRRDRIINMIKEKGLNGEISIKDITSHFTDCGEKTIQRELGALVLSNVLKKTGDRRWSKYLLA